MLEWIPEDFEQPWPCAYPDWSIKTTKPLPYRPFRYGPKYNVTMGIRTMEWEKWIELDNEWPSYHQQKIDRIATRGARLVLVDDMAKDAAQETLELLSKYLTKRYPTLFRYTNDKEEAILILETGEVYPILNSPDPMKYAALLVQDDLAIMMEGPDGLYYLRAGAICLAGFWRIEDKFGMPLEKIHTSGDGILLRFQADLQVPQYKEKLHGSLLRFFQRIKPNGPVERNNYFIQTDSSLPWSEKIGSEDSFGIGWDNADTRPNVDEIHFRSERQTLRRLPRSGGVLFTIRTYMLPVREMSKEKWVPGRFASAIRSWGEDVARYKGLRAYKDVSFLYHTRVDRKGASSIFGPGT
jgi:alpha-1,2-mannosyltransferase